jgi:hypothetical protein
VTAKQVTSGLYSEKIRGWIMKNFKKIMNIAKSNEEVNFGRKTTEIGAGFKKFLQKNLNLIGFMQFSSNCC